MKMSKKRTCFLDIKQLLKLDKDINYFSTCPACKEQVSDHKDTDFLRDEIAKVTDAVDDIPDTSEELQDTVDSGPPRKKTKLPVTASEAVVLIKKVHIFDCFAHFKLTLSRAVDT